MAQRRHRLYSSSPSLVSKAATGQDHHTGKTLAGQGLSWSTHLAGGLVDKSLVRGMESTKAARGHMRQEVDGREIPVVKQEVRRRNLDKATFHFNLTDGGGQLHGGSCGR